MRGLVRGEIAGVRDLANAEAGTPPSGRDIAGSCFALVRASRKRRNKPPAKNILLKLLSRMTGHRFCVNIVVSFKRRAGEVKNTLNKKVPV